MKTSQRGIDFIKEFEGFSAVRYICSAGKTTLGIGHVIRPGEVFPDTLSESGADALLARDLERFETDMLEAIEVDLNQNEFDAIISLAFNCGAHAIANSTLMKLLNGGASREQCALQFLRWDKANGKPLPGLTRRRKAEMEMFLS